VLDLDAAAIGNLSPSTATNIVEFAPVYLQASWYNCSASECMTFESADGFLDPDSGLPPQVLEPGEGDAEGCVVQTNGCKNITENQAVIEGVSVFLLTNEDWLPEEYDNQFNDPGGFNVFLFR
jgi:hypothetical protein